MTEVLPNPDGEIPGEPSTPTHADFSGAIETQRRIMNMGFYFFGAPDAMSSQNIHSQLDAIADRDAQHPDITHEP